MKEVVAVTNNQLDTTRTHHPKCTFWFSWNSSGLRSMKEVVAAPDRNSGWRSTFSRNRMLVCRGLRIRFCVCSEAKPI